MNTGTLHWVGNDGKKEMEIEDKPDYKTWLDFYK